MSVSVSVSVSVWVSVFGGAVGLVGMTPGGGGRFPAPSPGGGCADGAGGPVAVAWTRGATASGQPVARSGDVRVR